MCWLVPVHFCFMTLEQNKILDALGHFILGLTLILYCSRSSSHLSSGSLDPGVRYRFNCFDAYGRPDQNLTWIGIWLGLDQPDSRPQQGPWHHCCLAPVPGLPYAPGGRLFPFLDIPQDVWGSTAPSIMQLVSWLFIHLFYTLMRPICDCQRENWPLI